MEAYIQLPPDFSLDDFQAVASRLEQAGILTPGYIVPEVGMYDFRHYLYDQHIEGKHFWVVPDRNLVSRVVQLGNGQPLTEERRHAADLMAFCQYLNINFDPSICFHELASQNRNGISRTELEQFTAANNLPAQDWMSLAQGRLTVLTAQPPVPETREFDLSKPLRRWKRNYVAALKIGSIELGQGQPVEKVVALLRWMFEDFFIAGPAFVFACLYFAPNSRRRRLLKKLRSSNRQAALDGARNSAWDITYLSEFVRHVEESMGTKKRLLFATSDRALSHIAPTLIPTSEEEDSVDFLARRLAAWWPDKDARRIAETYGDFVSRMDEGDRREKRSAQTDLFEKITIRFESEVLAWKA